MRKTTKFLTLVLAVLMAVSMFATSTSAAFEDVDYTTAEGDAVNLLVSLGITKGTTETKFGTDELVTRQQMAAFIYRLMKAGRSQEGGVNQTPFTDLEDSTFFYMISWANQTGIIKGVSETRFNPKGNITLQDAYVMITRALEYEKNGALSYPFGYIAKAEEIGLDEDLPSTLGYTDALTRGNVAVILANAFYADMATYEIAYESLGYDIVYDENGDAIGIHSKGTRPYNKYDTVASKVFGVEKVTEYIVATPNYTIDGYDEIDEKDGEMVTFAADKDGVFAMDPDDDNLNVDEYALGTIEFAELGLEGKADDYFMAGIELFIKKDGSEKKVIGATSLMTKKTVSGKDVKFGTVSGTADKNYYTNKEIEDAGFEVAADAEDDAKSDYKRLNGLITIDGVATYVFNAPYSYAKPEKLEDIDADNVNLVGLYTYNGNAEEEDEDLEEKYVYTYIEGISNFFKKNDADCAFLGIIGSAYLGALYEVEVYDIDGDGRYEFIDYRPYSLAIVDDEEDAFLSDNNGADFLADKKLYIDRTIMKGEKVADEDIVVAYVNPVANFADVKAVLKGTDTYVSSEATKYSKFATGEKHYFLNANLVLTNAEDLNDAANFTADTEGTFYFYDGKLVYMEGVSSKVNFNEDWVVVLDPDTTATTVKEGNTITKADYVTIYHDGAIKDVMAKKITTESNKYDPDTTPVTYDGADFDFTEYVDKLAVAKTDAKGAYYFEIADYAGNNDKTVLADKDDEDLVYIIEGDGIGLTKKTGYSYQLTGVAAMPFTTLTIKDYTQIIIKTVDKDGDDIVEVYGYDRLPNFDDAQTYDNVTVIIGNNKNSTRTENLVAFYGRTDAEIETDKGDSADYRIVKSYEKVKNSDDETVVTFTTYDPYTGSTEDLEATNSDETPAAAGTILAKTTAGYLDNEFVYGTINPGTTKGIVDLDTDKDSAKEGKLGWVEIENYDTGSKVLEIAGDDNVYTVTKDTVVTFWDQSDASMKTVSTDVLSSTSSTYRYKSDKTNKLRAFVSAEEDDKADEEGYYNVVFVVIVRD